jgi:hypothetical protein
MNFSSGGTDVSPFKDCANSSRSTGPSNSPTHVEAQHESGGYHGGIVVSWWSFVPRNVLKLSRLLFRDYLEDFGLD